MRGAKEPPSTRKPDGSGQGGVYSRRSPKARRNQARMSTAHNPPGPSGGIVHEVRWSDALPWWILFRAAGAAFAPTVIFLALFGVVAMEAGWSACDRAGLAVPVTGGHVVLTQVGRGDLALLSPRGENSTRTSLPMRTQAIPWLPSWVAPMIPETLVDLMVLVAIPFQPTSAMSDVLAASARLAWFILVWAIFGTAITRCVAIKLAGEEPVGPVGAIAYGSKKWPPAVSSVLFVLVGIFALSIPGALLGLAMRTDLGTYVVGLLWPLVLLGAVVLAILAIGVAVGWPLMVAAVGVERADSFQAISTAFSYVYQRPLHYAFHALVALIVAIPACAAAGVLAETTATLAMWAASFGMGHDRTAVVVTQLGSDGGAAALGPLRFWTHGLVTLVTAFAWGYFWSLATASYLVLRHEVDGTEMDEVVIDEPGTHAA